MLSADDQGYFTVMSAPEPGSPAAKLNIEKGDKVRL